MNYCPDCAAPIEQRIPDDDNRPRAVCSQCGAVHYENPKLVLGTLPIWNNKILLCKRAIAPRSGYWTLPAGFMEVGESTTDGAHRETLEESGADVEMGPIFAIFDIPHVAQVHIFFRAEMRSEALDPGPETTDARLFGIEEIPWDDLAFRSVRAALELFIEDQRLDRHMVHRQTILI